MQIAAKIACVFFFMAVFFTPNAMGDPMKGPWDSVKKIKKQPHATDAGQEFVIGIYRKIISPAAGNRCPMHPSCSRYSMESFKKYGPLKGYIMTCDRLMRCGRDELSLSPKILVNGRFKCLDPVKNNDIGLYSKKTNHFLTTDSTDTH